MEDLRESGSGMDEMEQIRSETELEKQHQAGGAPREREQHRDSGVGGDMAGAGAGSTSGQAQSRHITTQADTNLKRSAINNSLLDLSASHSVLGDTKGAEAAPYRLLSSPLRASVPAGKADCHVEEEGDDHTARRHWRR